jgi:hypothetical protein
MITTTNKPTELRKLLNELETPAERSARIKNLTGMETTKPYRLPREVRDLTSIKLRIDAVIERILNKMPPQ